MTFDATPPGQEPTKTTPAATWGGNPNVAASPAPTNGMMENCKTIPTSTARGIFNTRAKSDTLSIVPMPNMMT